MNREKFRSMSQSSRIRYIWDYYKLPILAGAFIFILFGSLLVKNLTQKKTVYTVALANVASVSEILEHTGNDFLSDQNLNPAQNEVRILEGIYLTANPEDPQADYAWSSRMKLSALTEKKDLDAVLMNRQAFDILAAGGFLMNLDEFLEENDTQLHVKLKPELICNSELISLNSPDMLADELEGIYDSSAAESIEYPMALNLKDSKMLRDLKLSGDIFLGVIRNTGKEKESLDYIRFWMQE